MNQHIDTTVASLGHGSTIVGSIWALCSWLASSQAGVLYGLVGIVGGIAVNIYFKRRQDAREQEEHVARMRKLVTKPGDLS